MTTMHRPRRTLSQRRAAARGFSLVEIMVALVIGMIATTVVLQLFADSERRNRTASGTADAQSTGMMAFYQLQNNIQKAGYGISAISLLNCPTQWPITNGTTIAKSVVLAPVSINPKDASGADLLPAGDFGSDTLLIFFGNGNSQPQGSKLSGQPSGNQYPLQSTVDLAVGDRVILSPDNTTSACSAGLNIDRVTAVSNTNVTVAHGYSAGGAEPALFNLGLGPDGNNAAPSTAFPNNGPTILAYAIRNQTLTVCDFTVHDCSASSSASDNSVWVPLATNLVSLRAVYMKDTSSPMDGTPDADGHNQTQPATACDWVRTSAINLALVARSDEVEHNPEHPDQEWVTSTTNAPNWSDNAIAPLSTASSAWRQNLGDTDAWRKYRYKTFESVVSIRNIAWMGVPDACGP